MIYRTGSKKWGGKKL